MIVGEAADLVHSNTFEYYSNYLNLNNVTTNLPSDDESSTIGAFFMSKMEKSSAVKSITNMGYYEYLRKYIYLLIN